ncbi:Domain of unknown function (DUF1985 [Striga hermonthica]|uniref:DUF1985 domain-containing protein n=1 Tax=Striga hermonthica TaxID=68872 RepID=A0A9N7NL78_STRHE|nr:Domain of unknown function (DUF1985 [Striga hermonthica]
MEYAFDIPSTCFGVVTNRCDLKVVNHVFEGLYDEHQDLFLESCFRPLVHILELKLSSQIIHHLLMRTLKSSDNEKHAVWFKFGENQARLGLQEFSLVTGLKIVDDPEYEIPERSSSLLHLFKKKRGKIMRKDLLEKFDNLKKKEHAHLKYKLGLITVLEHVILSAECRTLVDEKWFHLVEDLEHFNSYHWGNLSYGYTVKLFKRNTFGKIKNPKLIKYSLHGFPLAIMVWAFEALPESGRQFGEHCSTGGLPRIMCWKMDKHLRSEQLTTFFNTSEVQVRRTLQPSSDEVETSYLKDFSITSEEQEIVLDDEEEEKGEKNEAENEDEDGEEEEEEEEEKNDTSQSDPPQTQVLDAENIRTIVREVVTEVVKDEMRIFSERMEMKMDMKMNNFFDRIEKLVFQAKAGPSTRATYDGTNVDEEVDSEINMRDTETGRTIDGVEDTVKSPSPMPQ